MKRKFLIATLIVAGAFALGNYGNVVTWTALSSPGCPWRPLGTITASNATLGVAARDYTSVSALPDANTVTWTPLPDVSRVELRFRTNTDADAHVVEMWVAANDYQTDSQIDSFTLGGIFTLTGGQQDAANSSHFVDTIAVSEVAMTDGDVLDSGTNRMAIYRVDLRGWKRVVFIATTLHAAKTIRIDARWY